MHISAFDTYDTALPRLELAASDHRELLAPGGPEREQALLRGRGGVEEARRAQDRELRAGRQAPGADLRGRLAWECTGSVKECARLSSAVHMSALAENRTRATGAREDRNSECA